MKTQAIVQTGVRSLELREFELPEVGSDDALLRIEQSGLCGSDWSQYTGGRPANVIPGHEPLGIIEQIGDQAAQRWGVQAGDRVAVETMLPCGYCRSCVSGKYNLCRAGGGPIHAYGYLDISLAPSLWGGHAGYMYLDPHTLVHRVDRSVPAELAVMFNPLGAGVRWAQRLPSTGIGDSVVILGCGQRGLASVIAAREAGAGTVVVTGLAADEPKLALAREFGADRTVNVDREDVFAAVREVTDGEMADIVVEVSSASTQPVSDALDLARPGGTIVLAGMKHGRVPEFDSNKIMSKELTIRGALAVDYDSYEAAIRIIERGSYPLELMHTHTMPLAEAERALRILGNEVEGEHGIHLSLTPE